MKRVAALLASLACPLHADIAPEMATQDCALSYEIATSTTNIPMTYEVAPAADKDGWCALGGVTIEADRYFLVKVHRLRWRVADYERLNQNLPPTALMLRVEGFAYVPQSGDPLMDYLFAVQAERNAYDAMLDLSWDDGSDEVILHNAQVDFGYDNMVKMTGRAGGIDLTDMAALQVSAGRAALHEMSFSISSFGLFENVIMMPLGSLLLADADDPAAQVSVLKAQGDALIDAVPTRILDHQSADALRLVLSEMPHPNGVLDVTLQSDNGIGSASFVGLALRGAPPSAAEIWSLLPDLTITATYQPEDPQ